MAAPDEEALAGTLHDLPGWQRHGDSIWKTYQFDDFASAALFVSRVADATAGAGHQPDVTIRGGRITLELAARAGGALTADDLAVAARIQRLERLAAAHLEELDRMTSQLHTLWAGLETDG